MADRDLVVLAADEYFADDVPQDSLLLVEAELVEPVGEAAEEALERVGGECPRNGGSAWSDRRG